MSSFLLASLRKHDLQPYYTQCYRNQVTYEDLMALIPAEDYSIIKLKDPNDKNKFKSMYQEYKKTNSQKKLENNITKLNKVSSKSSSVVTSGNSSVVTSGNSCDNANNPSDMDIDSNNEEINTTEVKEEPIQDLLMGDHTIPLNDSIIPLHNKVSTDTITPKKRPYSSTKHSPERNPRRMTTANAIQRTSPGKLARDRRLSYMPHRESNFLRSPIRGSTTTKTTSPYKQQKSSSKPKILDDVHIVEPVKEIKIERPATRLLDAYGVPISSSRIHHQQKSNEVSSSLEAFVSKSKASLIIPSTTTTTASFQNDLQQRIRVCVRKRPLNKKEQDIQESDIVPVVGPRTIQLNAPKTKIDLTRFTETHAFTFDDVFDGSSTNEHIYSRTAQPLVDYVFNGGKATCFAHGQTGSGKTYTMLDPTHGLYVLAAQDIFRLLSSPEYSHLYATVGFYEIYQGQLYDLLNEKIKLTARDDGNGNIVIAGLQEYPVKEAQDLMAVFEYGNQGRTTGKTGANNSSSRSHAVLQVFVKTRADDKVYGKLSFIDLAGSERGADRGDANTKTRMEGAEINKSLLALKECIRALDQDKKHTPFRGSKLTQVLRDSFIGNSRTCMIATISPNNSNSEHTLNTLRYADRVKQLKGESDPRIANISQKVNTGESVVENNNNTDTASVASWGEDENLLEVDFPTEVTSNALSTPTNNRFWSIPEDRQEKYMKRLESPPAEVFMSMPNNIMEDPFFSKPVNTSQDISMDSTMTNLEISNKKPEMDVRQIRSFLRIHRNQAKQFEECLVEEKKMISRISFAINDQEEQSDEVSDKVKNDYENYLNDLDEILERKLDYINILKSKIKGELQDD